jgi:RNA polymerase-associated protein LEO1
MQSETHRLLVKAVGQKHNKVAKLKFTDDPKVDPEREKLELIKQNAKKSKAKRAAHDELGYGRKKRRSTRSTDRGDIYTDDEDETGMYAGEEEDDDEHRTSVSPRKAKRKATDDATEDYQVDDFLVRDESDDDGAGARSKTKGNVAEEDDLEKMEAKIEKQAASDRKGRGQESKKSKAARGEATDDDQGAMDVESEEEEDRVRRVTSKRAIAVEDEDE